MWERVIVHHSATRDDEGTQIQSFRDYHTKVRRWRDLGYHAVVEDLDGHYEVIQGRPLNQAGAHCRGRNRDSLGICFAGNFNDSAPPPAQLIEGAKWIAAMLDLMGLDRGCVFGHSEVAQYGPTDCPGNKFDWDLLNELIDRFRVKE